MKKAGRAMAPAGLFLHSDALLIGAGYVTDRMPRPLGLFGEALVIAHGLRLDVE
jgi:hypothetical protein